GKVAPVGNLIFGHKKIPSGYRNLLPITMVEFGVRHVARGVPFGLLGSIAPHAHYWPAEQKPQLDRATIGPWRRPRWAPNGGRDRSSGADRAHRQIRFESLVRPRFQYKSPTAPPIVLLAAFVCQAGSCGRHHQQRCPRPALVPM